MQRYGERIEKLSQQDKLSKFCTDAGFLTVVEVGQYFTILAQDQAISIQDPCRSTKGERTLLLHPSQTTHHASQGMVSFRHSGVRARRRKDGPCSSGILGGLRPNGPLGKPRIRRSKQRRVSNARPPTPAEVRSAAIDRVRRLEAAIDALGAGSEEALCLEGILAQAKRGASLAPVGERLDSTRKYVERCQKRFLAAEDAVKVAISSRDQAVAELEEGQRNLENLRLEAAAQASVVPEPGAMQRQVRSVKARSLSAPSPDLSASGFVLTGTAGFARQLSRSWPANEREGEHVTMGDNLPGAFEWVKLLTRLQSSGMAQLTNTDRRPPMFCKNVRSGRRSGAPDPSGMTVEHLFGLGFRPRHGSLLQFRWASEPGVTALQRRGGIWATLFADCSPELPSRSPNKSRRQQPRISVMLTKSGCECVSHMVRSRSDVTKHHVARVGQHDWWRASPPCNSCILTLLHMCGRTNLASFRCSLRAANKGIRCECGGFPFGRGRTAPCILG